MKKEIVNALGKEYEIIFENDILSISLKGNKNIIFDEVLQELNKASHDVSFDKDKVTFIISKPNMEKVIVGCDGNDFFSSVITFFNSFDWMEIFEKE